MNLNYVTHGDSSNPTLFMVHGFLSCNAQWLPNIPYLSEKYQLVTAELWGHGQSPLPDEDLTVEGYLEAFENIRKALDIEKWGVIGQSYAAGLTIRYAIQHPSVVSKLVVTNSRSALGNLNTNGPRRSTQTKGKRRANNRHMPIHPVYAKRIPEPTLSALIEAADSTTSEAINRGGKLGTKLASKDLLRDIPCAFAITNGIYEKSFQKDIDDIRAISDIQIVDMHGGHAVNIEAADEFNEFTYGFFDEN
ncbi:MAG: alpha/beta hydrolase [Pseudomonadales bacterium]|nr:alpha/beta hydrolase [Pseudomonadales bacterium]MBO6594834.1 alpha/beta hydrolase [Pseudomonadales bacterium]MBO6821606.1 alpha/beta hydrolase [Pseudomonadales bacterium]